MKTSRYCCGVAVMNGKLYAVGGVDKRYNKLSSVESFDPATGVWSDEPDMLTARYNCGVEEADGKMYVVGGRDEKNKALRTVECFDGKTGVWSSVAEMTTVRSSGAVAVLPPVR
jgi:N-acetylneuraminic acid mutarotase